MRSIEFRGKGSDGKGWIEGLPIYLTEYAKDMNEIDGIQCNKTRMNYDIHPDTLCQFSGLTDNDLTRLFEYDYVASEYYKLEGYIEFYYGAFCLNITKSNNESWNVGQKPDLIEFIEDIKLIGNIYDNPELIK